MSRIHDRLRKGERWWTAEIAVRAVGLVLLAGCGRVALLAHRLIHVSPPHPATPGEFAASAATVLLLCCGLALTCEGPGVFRDVPIPALSAYFPRS